MEGDVNDNLCMLVQLVPILKNAQLVSSIRHKISLHTNEKRKQKIWIQTAEWSIKKKKQTEIITKVIRKQQ